MDICSGKVPITKAPAAQASTLSRLPVMTSSFVLGGVPEVTPVSAENAPPAAPAVLSRSPRTQPVMRRNPPASMREVLVQPVQTSAPALTKTLPAQRSLQVPRVADPSLRGSRDTEKAKTAPSNKTRSVARVDPCFGYESPRANHCAASSDPVQAGRIAPARAPGFPITQRFSPLASECP